MALVGSRSDSSGSDVSCLPFPADRTIFAAQAGPALGTRHPWSPVSAWATFVSLGTRLTLCDQMLPVVTSCVRLNSQQLANSPGVPGPPRSPAAPFLPSNPFLPGSPSKPLLPRSPRTPLLPTIPTTPGEPYECMILNYSYKDAVSRTQW